MSKVIKSGASGNVRRALVEGDAADARLDAKAEAQRIVDDARAEAERIKRQAEVEGRERGLAAVSNLLVGARAAAARVRGEAEAELWSLAVRIAQKILGRELKLDGAAVADVVAEALRHAGEPRELVIRCNAEDLAAIERGKPRLVERCRAAQAARFVVDERVERGGCIVETDLGVIDARLSTQLDAIERALRGE